MNADLELDAKGLMCPEPVMLLHKKVKDLESGQVLKILATDPSTTRDIPKFCQFLGFDLLDSQQSDDEFIYWIKKPEA